MKTVVITVTGNLDGATELVAADVTSRPDGTIGADIVGNLGLIDIALFMNDINETGQLLEWAAVVSTALSGGGGVLEMLNSDGDLVQPILDLTGGAIVSGVNRLIFPSSYILRVNHTVAGPHRVEFSYSEMASPVQDRAAVV